MPKENRRNKTQALASVGLATAPDKIRRGLMMPVNFPTIVCLCGSTRFGDTYRQKMLELTLAGEIVVTVGAMTQSDNQLLASGAINDEVKARLDVLHKQKIFLADYVLILNVGGYIGDSTRSEIEFATAIGKPIRYLEPFTPSGFAVEEV